MCEQCGHEYESKEFAEYCENYQIEDCPIGIGDMILVESRYDGFFEEKVIDVKLIHNPSFDGESVIDRRGNEFTAIEWLEKFNTKPHNWVILTGNKIEVCKDGTTSNEWALNEIVDLKQFRWNLNYHGMPESCFVNVGHKIIRSGKEHFEKYWGPSDFVSWLEKC
jgi:hypothetical protein